MKCTPALARPAAVQEQVAALRVLRAAAGTSCTMGVDPASREARGVRKSSRGLLLAALALAVLSGCLPRPRPQPETRLYDFGPAATVRAATVPTLAADIVVRPPEAPLWMDSPTVNYRLAYDEPARIRTYAFSRWVASPIRLFGDLLRRRVAEASTTGAPVAEETDLGEYVLQVQVEEFSQIFDSPGSSRAVVRARVSLSRHATRQVVAQAALGVERPAPTPNAEGGVQALADGSRELTDRIVAWLQDVFAKNPGLVGPAGPER